MAATIAAGNHGKMSEQILKAGTDREIDTALKRPSQFQLLLFTVRPEGQARVAAFLQSVQELDWTVGRNRQQVGENKRAAGRESSSGSS